MVIDFFSGVTDIAQALSHTLPLLGVATSFAFALPPSPEGKR